MGKDMLHICNRCGRQFPNGRSLGGHMRSHVVASRKEQKEQEQKKLLLQQQQLDPPSPSSSLGDSERRPYGLRENPKRSVRHPDRELPSQENTSAIVEDNESDTETAPSKHARLRSPPPTPWARSAGGPELTGSDSGTIPDEEVAQCLLMLSRDVWRREGMLEAECRLSPLAVTPRRGRYWCETCKKAFQSYQALGGHRASHKKSPRLDEGCQRSIRSVDPEADGGDTRIHVCTFCFRAFPSGQALGGHKRTHHMSAITAEALSSGAAPVPDPDRGFDGFIDLNLPAAAEDAGEYSAASNAES